MSNEQHPVEDVANLACSSEGCSAVAVETLFLRDQIGHVHDCQEHAHDLREFCDVIHSAPIIEGIGCLAVYCTARPVHVSQPSPLGGDLPPAGGDPR